MLAVLDASLVPRERDHVHFITRRPPVRWPSHWPVRGADSVNHVQKQTTRYPYVVTRQGKTDHVNVVIVQLKNIASRCLLSASKL